MYCVMQLISLNFSKTTVPASLDTGFIFSLFIFVTRDIKVSPSASGLSDSGAYRVTGSSPVVYSNPELLLQSNNELALSPM